MEPTEWSLLDRGRRQKFPEPKVRMTWRKQNG